MRLVLLIEEGHFFSSRFVADILSKRGREVVFIGLYRPRIPRHRRLQLKALKRIFLGEPLSGLKLAVHFLVNRVVGLLPPSWAGTHRVSVSRMARDLGIPVLMLDDLNSSFLVEKIKAEKIDIAICSISQVLKAPILSAPRLGCINRHASLLPAYGGVLPVFQAMLHSEKQVGVTAHLMDTGVDTGRILCQKAVPVEDTDSFWSLSKKIYGLSGDCLLRAIDILSGADSPSLVQPPAEPSYFGPPTLDDWRRFFSAGKRII